MNRRNAARVLLLGPTGRLLLLRGEGGPIAEGAASFWFTAGGGLEPGESVVDAARREILEETGLRDVVLGPAVWYSEQVLTFEGAPTLFAETFLVAHAPAETLDAAGWTALEREMIREWRWWSLAEIAASNEVMFPTDLAALLGDVIAGRYPAEPLVIARL
jgi:8-oxo-dGTP pyrophosphatase MutT (NUDIX family)